MKKKIIIIFLVLILINLVNGGYFEDFEDLNISSSSTLYTASNEAPNNCQYPLNTSELSRYNSISNKSLSNHTYYFCGQVYMRNRTAGNKYDNSSKSSLQLLQDNGDHYANFLWKEFDTNINVSNNLDIELDFKYDFDEYTNHYIKLIFQDSIGRYYRTNFWIYRSTSYLPELQGNWDWINDCNIQSANNQTPEDNKWQHFVINKTHLENNCNVTSLDTNEQTNLTLSDYSLAEVVLYQSKNSGTSGTDGGSFDNFRINYNDSYPNPFSLLELTDTTPNINQTIYINFSVTDYESDIVYYAIGCKSPYTNITYYNDSRFNCTYTSSGVKNLRYYATDEYHGLDDISNFIQIEINVNEESSGGGGGGIDSGEDYISPPLIPPTKPPQCFHSEDCYYEDPYEDFDDEEELEEEELLDLDNITFEFKNNKWSIIEPNGYTFLSDHRIKNKLNRTIRLSFVYNKKLSSENSFGWLEYLFNTNVGKVKFKEISAVNLEPGTLFNPYKYLPFEINIPDDINKTKYSIVYDITDNFGNSMNIYYIINTGEDNFFNKLRYWLNKYIFYYKLEWCKNTEELFSDVCSSRNQRTLILSLNRGTFIVILAISLYLIPTISKRLKNKIKNKKLQHKRNKIFKK